MSCSRKLSWTGRELVEEPSSMTPRTWSSKNTGKTAMLRGRRLAQARGDLHVVLRDVGDEDRLPLQRALADEAFARARSGSRGCLRFV